MVILKHIWYNYYIVIGSLRMHQGMEATLIANRPNKYGGELWIKS